MSRQVRGEWLLYIATLGLHHSQHSIHRKGTQPKLHTPKHPLQPTRCSSRLAKGPFCVITPCAAQPRHAIMARRPLRISFVYGEGREGKEGGEVCLRLRSMAGPASGHQSNPWSTACQTSWRPAASPTCSFFIASGVLPRFSMLNHCNRINREGEQAAQHRWTLHLRRTPANATAILATSCRAGWLTHGACLAAGVGRVTGAAEHGLQAQEVLLALAAGLLEVLGGAGRRGEKGADEVV